MNSFPQLPGEPADAFEQLLLHRDFGPSRQFSQTADVVGCSESTLRRRAEQWNWVERLADQDLDAIREVVNSLQPSPLTLADLEAILRQPSLLPPGCVGSG